MASYKDLLGLFRKGCSPEEILKLMPMRPSHLKRIMQGKRMLDALHMEESLAVAMAVHDLASGVHEAVERFRKLMESESPETVRKVCLAVLKEAFSQNAHHGRREQGAPSAPGGSSAPSGQDGAEGGERNRPWLLLGDKLQAPDGEGQPAEEDGDVRDLHEAGEIEGDEAPGDCAASPEEVE